MVLTLVVLHLNLVVEVVQVQQVEFQAQHLTVVMVELVYKVIFLVQQ